MLFNSFSFMAFFPVAVLGYYLCPKRCGYINGLLNGAEICRDWPGVNVVVLDKTTGARVQSIVFRAQDGYIPYTA